MTEAPRWFRVFAGNDVHPEPAALLGYLCGLGLEARGGFRGDDRGWFRAELEAGESGSAEVDCYLADEEGIRAELNGWAAWVEAAGDGPEHLRLMQHLIATPRLFIVRTAAAALGAAVCRFLARETAGVYQIDGEGFLSADGALLVAE
jgi:hypothetical protein